MEPKRPGCFGRLWSFLERVHWLFLMISNLALAGCTFYLACTTSVQAKATLEQVKASREALQKQDKAITQFWVFRRICG